MPQKQLRISRAVVDQVPKVFRLQSIKSRIMGLALLSTLIPSLAMAWISYGQNRDALTERINEELQSAGAQAARELDLWFKERLYDVRVLASSYVVSENIERALRTDDGGQGGARLYDYLTSVGERFPDYNELIVVDPQGQRLATSVVSRKYMDIMTGIEYVAPHPLGGGRSHGPGTSVEAARGQWEHP